MTNSNAAVDSLKLRWNQDYAIRVSVGSSYEWRLRVTGQSFGMLEFSDRKRRC